MDFITNNLPYLLTGISVGGQYALIAIGYTMVYGILRLINFAHGDLFMVGGLFDDLRLGDDAAGRFGSAWSFVLTVGARRY